MNIKPLLALLLLFCILLPALGQNKPAPPPPPQQPGDQDDVVKINTNLVQVDAVVTKNGKPVTNLTADDFEIFEDGRRQTITSFAYISNVPASAAQPVKPDKKTTVTAVPYTPIKRDDPHRTIAFVVDDLGLSAESMSQVRNQLRKFVAEQLQPSDLVAIIRTSGELGALQQFTNDKRLLNRAVDRLHWNFCSRAGVHVLPPLQWSIGDAGVNTCARGSYAVTLKSVRFIVDALGYLPGRKSMVLLSDSLVKESQDEFFDRSGLRSARSGLTNTDIINDDPVRLDYSDSLQKIAEKAIRSSVVIYSVDTQGLQYTGLTAADTFVGTPQQLRDAAAFRSAILLDRRKGGELIAKQTGGFPVRNSNSYEFGRILEDQSGYYLLGYRPSDETFNRRFHHIKAKVKRSGMMLRTRFGFFGVTEEEAKRAKPTASDQTNLALISPFAVQDIQVDLTSFFAEDSGTGTVIRSFVYLDPETMTFTPVDGRHQASFELHGMIFGDNGAVVDKVTRGATVKLTDAEYQYVLRNGLGLAFDMPVKRPGAYQVRLAARDTTSSKLGSTGQFVVVPDLKNKRLAVSGIVLGTGGAGQTIANPGARRFFANSELYYACKLYNATNEKGKLRNLVMNAMLLRDGKIVYSGPEVPIVASEQPDLSRVSIGGGIRLGAQLEPGYYYLQLVITDKDAKEKTASVAQWADFQIEKK
jgi:VWFA-related protein